MTNPLVQTFDLTKVYKLKGKRGQIKALDNVNISIKEGEIFGLLGPNGAGKTTMIQILTTLISPTSGYALIDGHDILKDPIQAKSRVALMLESQMLYYRITGYDNLKFFCKIYKVPSDRERIEKIATELQIEDWLDQYVEKYSSGMKMKLALCRTFLLNREILFLDEPTIGLDANLKKFIVEKLKRTNSTILLTSHDMDVIEKLCDRIAFINKGNIIKIGTKNDIKQLFQFEIKIDVEIAEKEKTALKSELLGSNFVSNIENLKTGLEVTIKNRSFYNNLLLILGKYEVTKFFEREVSLEDLFVNLIK